MPLNASGSEAILRYTWSFSGLDSIVWKRRSPKKIPHTLLPDDLQTRVSEFGRNARKGVHFIDLTLDSVPVIGCLIEGKSYPCFTSGYAASPHAYVAAEKAFDEAELMFHSWRHSRLNNRYVEEKKVVTVLDHFQYWAIEENSQTLDWLLSGQEANTVPADFYDEDFLIKKFAPMVIDLSPGSTKSGLHVVKVTSPTLMPINFGYMSEHYGHPRLNQLGYRWAWGYPSRPHCLA